MNGVRRDGVFFVNGNGPQAPQLNRNCSFLISQLQAAGWRKPKPGATFRLFLLRLFFNTLPFFLGLSLTIRII